MLLLRNLIIFAGVAFLIGCATQTYGIMEEYKGEEMYASELTIAPYSVTILNKDDVINDLGTGVAEEVFQNFFDSTFALSASMSPRIRLIAFRKNITAGSLTERELALTKKENIKLLLPKDGDTLEINSTKPEYVLIFNNYIVGRVKTTVDHKRNFTPENTPKELEISVSNYYEKDELVQQLYFAFWDNRNCKIISYGKVEAASEISSSKKAHWVNCIKQIAEKIMYGSPFYSKPKH